MTTPTLLRGPENEWDSDLDLCRVAMAPLGAALPETLSLQVRPRPRQTPTGEEVPVELPRQGQSVLDPVRGSHPDLQETKDRHMLRTQRRLGPRDPSFRRPLTPQVRAKARCSLARTMRPTGLPKMNPMIGGLPRDVLRLDPATDDRQTTTVPVSPDFLSQQ